MARKAKQTLEDIRLEVEAVVDAGAPAPAPAAVRRARKLIRTLAHRGQGELAAELQGRLAGLGGSVGRQPGPPRTWSRALRARPRHAESLAAEVPTLRPLEPMISSWFEGPLEPHAKIAVLDEALAGCEGSARRDSGGASTRLTMMLEDARRKLADTDASGPEAVLESVRPTAVRVLAELPAFALGLGLEPGVAVSGRVAFDATKADALRLTYRQESATRNGPAAREVDAGEMLLLWGLLVRDGSGPWIDLGSGDGRSLVGLAELNPGRELIGIDLRGSPTVAAAGGVDAVRARLPGNASLVELDGEHLEDVAATTVDKLGRGRAGTVTLLYPLHAPRRAHDGNVRLAHELQLEVAIDLLAGGGTGFLATEDPTAWRSALTLLSARPDLSSVSYCAQPLGPAQTEEMGFSGFTPTRRDVFGSPDPRPHEALGQFTWALTVLFTKND